MTDPKDMSDKDIVTLFNEIEQADEARGPKGEKAETVRSDIRRIIQAVKPASGEISLATLRKACYKLLVQRAKDAGATEEEIKDKESGHYVQLDQSYFAGIVSKTWKTRKDPVTKALIVLVNEELPPKIREPRKKKTKKAGAAAAGASTEDLSGLE